MKDKILNFLKNNKFDLFIIILASLVVLFYIFTIIFHPEFVYAADSVSDDEAYIQWTKDNRDLISQGLADNGYVVNPDFYLISDDTLHPTLWDQFLRNWGIEGTTVGKPPARAAYDYAVSNNMTIQNIYNDCFDTVYNYVESESAYVIYTVYHKADLVNLFQPGDSNTASWLSGFDLSSLPSDSFYYMQGNTTYYRLDGTYTHGNHHLSVTRFPLDFIDQYSFYALGDTPSSLFDNSNFFHNFAGNSSPSMPSFNFWSASVNGVPSSFNLSRATYYSTVKFSDFSAATITGNFGYLPFYYYGPNGDTYCLNGGFFIVPDSVETFSFLFFKSYNDLFSFYSGTSRVYKFDSDFDLSDYPGLNYDKLYDIISSNVNHASGNLADLINGVANDYLAKQIEILGDINNALNDENGSSWLRRIYGLLETVNENILNIQPGSGSGSGGSVSVDLSETNTILSDINSKLGLMIGSDPPDSDTETSLAALANAASTRMPFSMITDVVVIIALFNHEPVKPDLQMPVPFQSGETWTIDVSSYEYIRPIIQAFLIVGFLFILLKLSFMIIETLK